MSTTIYSVGKFHDELTNGPKYLDKNSIALTSIQIYYFSPHLR